MMSTTMKRIYMNMSVRGAIRRLSTTRSKRTGFTDATGKPMDKDQAVHALMDELAKGHECIPMSKGCCNPCTNSPTCKGFDYKGDGCPGYIVDETGEPVPAPAEGAPA